MEAVRSIMSNCLFEQDIVAVPINLYMPKSLYEFYKAVFEDGAWTNQKDFEGNINYEVLQALFGYLSLNKHVLEHALGNKFNRFIDKYHPPLELAEQAEATDSLIHYIIFAGRRGNR